MAEEFSNFNCTENNLEFFLLGETIAIFHNWDYVVRAHEIKLDSPISS